MFHDDCFDSLEHAEAAKEPEPQPPVRLIVNGVRMKPGPCHLHDCDLVGESEPTEPKPEAKPCCTKGYECPQ